ncbi:peptidase M61 [Neosynechococcus sphagnicola sy1]|uniref:Peptidase M61 n=2 Tax=Neosynechococcus TaxID=1501143 RepID=A0A098TNY0_9CYAN|nr:peptidase M61 [Neosynechococcus sphagnicola sy1]
MATSQPPITTQPSPLQIHYQVAMPAPATHLFSLTLQVQGLLPPRLDLKLPVWTPGSYLVREYARHLQGFSAATATGVPLSWRKLSKNHWQVETTGVAAIAVHYDIYANELSVRTNHLDTTHGYFNGAALFLYLPGWEKQPITVAIAPPEGWHVTTPLPKLAASPPTFRASDYDTLVDSPFEIGTHACYDFEVLGKPHQLAIWGQGNQQPEQLIQDIRQLIHTEAQLFGGLPYDRYLFLLHLSSQGNGGLEHKTSCSLNYPRFGFRNREKYQRFLQLVAHEFFHLWNVKRIRPLALETFDYDQENYTSSLWFSEGTTSYYDLLIPLRAGLMNGSTFLAGLSKEITRFLNTPGRRVQPLQESSFDAWIKLYRPDANSLNSQVSYYLKGELVSLLLDLRIRVRSAHQRSLDDVMRQMWQRFGIPEVGFTPEQLQQVMESVVGESLSDFWHCYVQGTEELPFQTYLEPFGLQLLAHTTEEIPYLGLTVKAEQGRDLVKGVESDSPAQHAGLDSGDELLAINGIRVHAEQLSERLKDFQPGDQIQLTVFHQDQLRTCPAVLASPQPSQYHIIAIAHPSPTQEQNCLDWLGTSLANLR